MDESPDFSPEAIAEALREATPGPWVWMFTGDKSNGWAMGTWQLEDGTWVPAGVELQDWEMERYVAAGEPDEPEDAIIIDQICESFDGNNYADAHLIANAPTWLAQLLAALEAAQRERDLAIAHDRQPYPTAWAYERVCDSLHAAEAALEAKDGAFRRVLKEHYLTDIVCLPIAQTDNPICQCSMVNLGYHPSVGRAVDAWIDHVMESLAAALAPSTPKEGG